MELEVRTWLFDLLNAVQEIESFLDGADSFSLHEKDVKTKRAAERNLEIIGKAVSRILKRDTSVQLSDSRKIIDTRNRIIHGYDTVSDEILRTIFTAHLPVLKQEVEQLLNE